MLEPVEDSQAVVRPEDDDNIDYEDLEGANNSAAAGADNASGATSNRPPSSAFHQQKLPAWQPLLTAGTVFPVFLIMSIAFICLGVALLLANSNISELSIDYTDCKRIGDRTPCANLVKKPEFYSNYSVCQCRLEFKLDKPMTGQVYAYYALTSFHQNHRKYVKSHDRMQLSGRRYSDLDAECEPYRTSADGKWIAPCGAVANSLFNDTFKLMRRVGSLETVPWTVKGISWSADVARKYGRVDTWNGTAKPPNWAVPESARSPIGYTGDEELQVWMTVAALPTFRKLHRRLIHSDKSAYAEGLPAGNYSLLVNYSYPVAGFGGTKSFVLATAGLLGGRNAGLGGLAIAVGCLHLALCCALAVLHTHAKRNRETDPYYGMDPLHRALLENTPTGASSADTASEDGDVSVVARRPRTT
ncbi:hypothetical protein BOX15_Mlig012769g2 [Macrostomum lignano]|uniref:Cell cycle control protein 50A n=1 Tax=Macrostomum lignano TaxID=282301 RepID=A0A267EAS5_9PLAT|nr:hypothetical protein BOX15_Mlig012769g2 [Macrostomum lignano]